MTPRQITALCEILHELAAQISALADDEASGLSRKISALEESLLAPPLVAQHTEIEAAIAYVQKNTAIPGDVMRIRYEIGEDWTHQPAVFFRILIADRVAWERLRRMPQAISSCLTQRLEPLSLGTLYFNYRSESEQAKLKEPEWEAL